jgi:hypothetical protein
MNDEHIEPNIHPQTESEQKLPAFDGLAFAHGEDRSRNGTAGMHDGLRVRVVKCVDAGAETVDERCMQHIRPARPAEQRRLWRPGKL